MNKNEKGKFFHENHEYDYMTKTKDFILYKCANRSKEYVIQR
jgi:hypothetical protein